MKLKRVEQLFVYSRAFDAAMGVFQASKCWPKEERYALTDQVRRSSRSVCANLSEAWAKRRYPKHFVSKLSDAHGEAEETLTWLTFAHQCGYLLSDAAGELISVYRQIIAGLVRMMNSPESWCLPDPLRLQP